MIYLILGLLLWVGVHFLKRLALGLRRDLDKALGKNAARGIVALSLLVALGLMIFGYRQAEFIPVYTPYAGIGHLNNLLMLFAIFAMGIGPAGGRLSARFRHPMLAGAIIFAVAHLLVNGDVASIILFGGVGLWALVQRHLINQHEGPWERPMPGNAIQDGKLALSTLFIFVIIAGIHWLLDHNPFMGTYG